MKDITAVLLNDYCHINGGASRVAVEEAVGLAAAGVKVIFIGACAPVCEQLKNSSVEVVCLEQPELINAKMQPEVLMQGLWNLKAKAKVEEILDSLNSENTIIHLHGYTKALTTSPVRAAVQRGFKVVCTLHDFFAACTNGAFFDYKLNAPCSRRAMSLSCIGTNCDKRHYSHKLYRVARQAVQLSIGMLPRGVRDYITLSSRSAAIMGEYLPADARYYPLENPIDAITAPPVDVAANSSVVAVGRLDVEKGINLLIEAALQSGVNLTLVGDGALRAMAQAKGIHVTGWLTSDGVREELKKARCLAFPSLWYETYGLVVAEAAALGIPAIVSDISAAAERIEDGVDGWIMKSGDVNSLAQLLKQIQDDDLIRRAGRRAYDKFWHNPPTITHHVAGLMDIYSRILEG